MIGAVLMITPMKKPDKKVHTSVISRIPLYVAGIIVLCFGIVLCVKCGMGISPINSIPYVLTKFTPLSLGALSFLFYLINIALELILSEKRYYAGIILQLPVSLIFGVVIDVWDALLPAAGSIFMSIVCLCGSVFFTALGIMMIVAMHLVPDPPTGAVQAISRASKKKMGNVKIVYDCSCVIISLVIGLTGAHRIIGFGIATIVSAVFVGRILALLQGTIGKRLKRYYPE